MENDEEDYYLDYDSEDSHSIFFWDELIPTLVVYGVTFVLGLTGNCLMIYTTFRYRRMKNVTNVFLASLACSDLLLIIVCIPVKVAKLFSYTWEMGFFICKSVHYMQNVSAICSVVTLTAISMERYYAIVHPIKAKYICTISQAKRIILVIWILSLLLGVPTLIVQIHLPVGPHDELFWCVRNWDNFPIWRFHEIYMLVLIFVGPFIIMTFSYTSICLEVWRVVERRSIMTSEHALSKSYSNKDKEKDDKDKTTEDCTESIQLTQSKKPKIKSVRDDNGTVKQVICMLVAVVVLFAVCWTPLLVDNVLTAYDVLPNLRIGPLKHMSIAFHLLAYFSSCINPIIYGFMSRSFRESFALAICCFPEPSRNGRRQGSMITRYISRNSSHTRSTTVR